MAAATGDEAPAKAGEPGSETATGVLETVAASVNGVVVAVTTYASENAAAAGAIEGARAFLDAAAARATTAVESVRKLAAELKAVPATELPLIPIYEAINRSKLALLALLDAAQRFDEKYKLSASLQSALDRSRTAATTAITDGRERVQALVNRAAGADAGESASVQAAAAAMVTTSLSRTQEALEDVLKRVMEYDQVSSAKDKAGAFLTPALEATKAAAAEVARAAQAVRETPTRELPSAAVTVALEHANAALTAVSTKAQTYDEEHKLSESVTGSIASAKERATAAMTEARTQMDSARGTATSMASTAADAALRRLLVLDDRFGVSTTAGGVASTVAGHVRAVDEKYGITPTAAALDERYTGGYGAAAVGKAKTVVDGAIGAVSARIASLATSDDASTEKPAADTATATKPADE